MRGTFCGIIGREGGEAGMMTKMGETGREQVEIISLDELVPAEHIVRKIEAAIDWSFIYEFVEESYCEDNGRPSLDPLSPYYTTKSTSHKALSLYERYFVYSLKRSASADRFFSIFYCK